jgi:single-strand DNA-binding protein
VNVVTLLGDLATDIEVRELGNGKKVASFLLTVERGGPAGGADFIRIAAWNRQAEACARRLGRGNRVAVDGRLRSRSWEDPDGKRRSAVEVVAKAIEFLPSEGESSQEGARMEAAVAH